MFTNKGLDTRLKVSIVPKYLSAGLKEEGRKVQQFKILFIFRQEWTDINLAWNKTEYDGITDIRIPPRSVSSSSDRNPQINILKSFLTEIFGSLTS